MFSNFDFSRFANDAAYYVDDQRARQDGAVERGLGYLLPIAGYHVGDEAQTERTLSSHIGAALGCPPSTSDFICRLMVGRNPMGHVFKRGRNGILIRHNGPLGKLAAMAA